MRGPASARLRQGSGEVSPERFARRRERVTGSEGQSPPERTEFRYKRRVQFADTDLAGIIHFSTMFRYIEEAEHALWRACGLSIAERNGPLGWPRLNAALEFRNPLRFEEEFEILVRIAALKRRTIEYEFVLRRDDTLIALGTMTCICVRKQSDGTMKATEIPSDIAAKLAVFVR